MILPLLLIAQATVSTLNTRYGSKLSLLVASTIGSRTFKRQVLHAILDDASRILIEMVATTEHSQYRVTCTLALAAKSTAFAIQKARWDMVNEMAQGANQEVAYFSGEFIGALNAVERSLLDLVRYQSRDLSVELRGNVPILIARIRKNVGRRRVKKEHQQRISRDAQNLEDEIRILRERFDADIIAFYRTLVVSSPIELRFTAFVGAITAFQKLQYQYILLTVRALKAKEAYAACKAPGLTNSHSDENVALLDAVITAATANCFETNFSIADSALTILVKSIIKETASMVSPACEALRAECAAEWAIFRKSKEYFEQNDVVHLDVLAATGDVDGVMNGRRMLLRNEAIRIKTIDHLIDLVRQLVGL